MVDSAHGGTAGAAFPATASAGGGGGGAARFTSVVPLHASEAGVSLSSLMDALSRLEALFRTSGEALSATVPHSASDPSTEHVAGRDGGKHAPSTEPQSTAPQVFSTLDALAAAAARCDTEVGQQLAVLRRGVAALAQELSTLSERYPSVNARGSCAGATGGAGLPSSQPAATLRTPQIMASSTSAPAGGGTGGTAPALRGSFSDNSPGDRGPASSPPAHRSSIVTPTTTPRQLPADSFANRTLPSDAGVPLPGPAAPTASTPVAKPAALASSTHTGSGASPPLRASASPCRAAPPTISPASSPLGFSLVDKPGLQLPAAQLPHAACVETVKKYLGRCVEWPPRPREPRRARPRQGFCGGRGWKREDSSDGGRADGSASQLRSSDGQPTRLRLSSDNNHQRSETDEFLRWLTDESPYELSELCSRPFNSRGSPEASSVRSGCNSNSGSYGSGGDYDFRFEEEEQQQRRQLPALGVADRRASTKVVVTGSGKRHRSHGSVQTTPTRHTPRRRTRSTKADGADAQPQQVSRRRGRPTLQESVDALVLGQLRADGIALPASMEAELCWCGRDDVDAASQCVKVATEAAAAAWAPVSSAKGAKQFCDGFIGGVRSSAPSDVEADFAVVLQEVRTLVRHGEHGSGCSDAPSIQTTGATKELSPSVDNPCFELSRVSVQLSRRLPTTSAWLAQINDFCTLLEDMAVAAAIEDADGTASAEEDRQEGAKAGLTQRSPTSPTSLTRERASAAPKAFSFSSSAPSSPNRSSSDAAAAASANDFSTVADELFSSAEEVEGSDGGESGDGPRRRTELSSVRSIPTPRAAAVQTAPVPLMTALEHSVSIVQPSLHSSQSSSAAPSSFRDTFQSVDPHRDDAGAEGGEPLMPSQENPSMRATAALRDVWLGGFDVAGVRVVGSGVTAVHAASTGVGLARNSGSTPLAQAPTSSLPSLAQNHWLPRPQCILTPCARALAERQCRAHEAQENWQQTLRQRQEALLRRRCVRVRADTPEPRMEGSSLNTGAPGAPATDDAGSSQAWTQGIARGKVAPVMDHKAAAAHLRALCALLQTDLIVISTLQELSTLMHTTSVSLSDSTTAREGKFVPPPNSTSSFFAAATRLLVSLQQHHKMQARCAQEARILHDVSDATALSSSSAYPLASISDPLTQYGCSGGAATDDDGTDAAPLILSVLHPMSALGYTPMLWGMTSTAVDGLLRGDTNGAGDTLSPEEHLARYIVAVAPYLLAWQAGAADAVNSGGAPRQEVPRHHGCMGLAGGECTLPLAPASCAASLSRLPLPVRVYVESLTTTVLEEARKLNSMYELYMLLVAEATLQSRRSSTAKTACAADVATVACTPFSLAPVWHGGTDETLMSYVRRRGRAAAIAQGTGVLGMAMSLDNGLEKYVAPVSAYLLNSFDQLEGRHLLHSVFQEVQLSDVVARARARRDQQMSSSPPGQRRSPGAASPDEEEGLDSFSLPPGTMSSPATRSAASGRSSVRGAEQRGSSGRGGGGGESYGDQAAEQQRRGDNDGDTTRQRRGRATARRLISLSGPGQTRHAIIEGFVRYLTGGDRRRSGATSGGGDSSSPGADQRSATESGRSPSQQRSSSHPTSHHHSGLTLDVPHTSSLLQEMDARLEAGASNVRFICSVERLLQAGSLVDALTAGKLLPHTQAELSTRHYFNARAATFTTRHTLPSYSAACVSVVQCRWQPVFQSTMCFCPVTRRRCLDPLVCGALLSCATLPPQEIIHATPDPSQSSTPTPTHGVSGGPEEVVVASAVGAAATSNATRQLPNTIRALRSRFERSTESSRPVPPRQTQAPSPRSDLPPPPSSAVSLNTPSVRTALSGSPLPQQQQPQYQRLQQLQPPALPLSHATHPDPIRIISVSSLFPAVLLRGPSTMPDPMTVSRVMTRAVTALYADPSVPASDGEVRRQSEGEAGVDTTATAAAAAVAPLNSAAVHALRAVTVSLEMPPVTRNLLPSPDRSSSSLLNPPTLLECGHVVSHKTYLDLRTTARRTNRNTASVTAGTTTVVCCPYCSKVTAVKDALTLSYLY
ncbi:hypothetical protein GH5_05069 [Leishmania sp. Ghana 2012 LV757]|uniref:hypothetical protein n=1 Tax=Leishmania sp. Ghana 2012 LV757 TaxID=2803181 RepID=UPI001B4F86FC|nr:hypothetical protein GH5_05069 [Leishmania sp. Ghana 2012 LV757]